MHVKNNLEMIFVFQLANWQCKETVAEMVICSSRVTKEIRSSSSPVVAKNRIAYYLQQRPDEQRAGTARIWRMHDILGQW